VAAPLAIYYSLRSAGAPQVPALVASGVPPALGIALGAWRRRRLDALGVLVLAGIVVGAVVGLVSGQARLVLLDGVVGTAVFGGVCLASLLWRRPLMFRFALEGMGPETAKGREFAALWRYPGFRHAMRVTTVVWGLAFLAEAALQLAIIERASVGTAKTTSNVLPLAVFALVGAWNVAYARRGRRQAEQAAEDHGRPALSQADDPGQPASPSDLAVVDGRAPGPPGGGLGGLPLPGRAPRP
jgi:hypothetical protein